jgi:hypothetical protein
MFYLQAINTFWPVSLSSESNVISRTGEPLHPTKINIDNTIIIVFIFTNDNTCPIPAKCKKWKNKKKAKHAKNDIFRFSGFRFFGFSVRQLWKGPGNFGNFRFFVLRQVWAKRAPGNFGRVRPATLQITPRRSTNNWNYRNFRSGKVRQLWNYRFFGFGFSEFPVRFQ